MNTTTTAQGLPARNENDQRLCDCCRTGCPDNDGPAEVLATVTPATITGLTGQAFCGHCWDGKGHLETCAECGEQVNTNVKDAYELLYGGGSLRVDSLLDRMQSFARMADEDGGKGMLTDNDYAGLAVMSWMGGGYELAALIAAVRHRQQEEAQDAPLPAREPVVFGVVA